MGKKSREKNLRNRPEIPVEKTVNRKKIIAFAIIGDMVLLFGIFFGVLYYTQHKNIPVKEGMSKTASSTPVEKKTEEPEKRGVNVNFGSEGLVLTEKFTVGKETLVMGLITDKRTDIIPANSPAILDVRMKNGETARIIYSPGSAECVNAISGENIRIGQNIEALGKATSGGTIFTCDSKKYYIKTLEK